ncbi:uncharacterized protein LOC125717129 [Brienomyrus brachyistius]|uniref:uncharacterized protein LOC125717129 n=1 Tax=Brienomyrus brachyistius TaxID=42636 RepID=UPI0020B3251F|nr:uncharacterized protein LOC125717129 [Brienomyrus brachyistius]
MMKSCILVIITITAGLTAGDDISPNQLEYFSHQGESVTLSCSYRSTSDYIFLYWYRQHSNQGPQFILYKGARSYDGNEHNPDKRFKSATSRVSTQLTIDSPTIADTAIYYCALRVAQEIWVQRGETTTRQAVYISLSEHRSICLCLYTLVMAEIQWIFLIFAACLFECRAEDAVNQSTVDVIVYEGESVILNCTYVTDRVPFLFWYIQYPNDSPKHLLRAVDTPPDLKDKFHAILDKNVKTAPLTVQNVQLSDSAVYYCALLAQEHCIGNFMEWVSRAEQLHPTLTSRSAMQSVRCSDVKHAATGL